MRWVLLIAGVIGLLGGPGLIWSPEASQADVVGGAALLISGAVTLGFAAVIDEMVTKRKQS